MKRRTALVNMALVTGGITLLSRCKFGEDRVPLALNNLKVSTDQEDLLKEVVSSMIPPGEDLHGAESVEAHNFVWVMVDDCLGPEDQKKFLGGLNDFEPYLKDKEGKKFHKLDENEKAVVLSKMANPEDPKKPDNPDQPDQKEKYNPDNIQYFINTTKRYTLQGYMKSQYIMTDIMPYALVPGFFHGCVPDDPNKRINING